MTANVALTDTFDQWRVKTNEVVVMTQTDGMSNFIKIWTPQIQQVTLLARLSPQEVLVSPNRQ